MSTYTNESTLPEFTAIAAALADPGRVRALNALRDNELCVCQLVELLELAPSTVSRHLKILARASLVHSRKDGRWVYYRRRDPREDEIVRAALEFVDRAAAGLPEDRERLARILACPVEELCRNSTRGA